jgi:hypothetical protein
MNPAAPSSGHPLLPDPNLPCEACGHFGAAQIADRSLCADCVAECGSCCADPAD